MHTKEQETLNNNQKTQQLTLNQTQPGTHQRARWANRVHHVGQDIAWAAQGWNGVPRTMKRAGTLAVAYAGGKATGADDIVALLAETLQG